MTNRSPSTDQSRPISIAGIQRALMLSLVAAGTFCLFFFMSAAVQHDRKNGTAAAPTWALLLALAFVLIPYVVSFVLLSIRRHEFVAAGAGVAAAFFGIIVLVSPY